MRVVPLVAGLLLVIGLLLVPDLVPRQDTPVSGQERVRATVIEVSGRTNEANQPLVTVRLEEGPSVGTETEAVVQHLGQAVPGSEPPRYEVGDEVVVSVFGGSAG